MLSHVGRLWARRRQGVSYDCRAIDRRCVTDAEDAKRDGVIPALAALTLRARSDARASLDAPEGTWVISGPTEALHRLANQDTGGFGNEAGKYGVDFIGPSEYGEVLLLAKSGKVRRAYPMPGVPPSWIYATGEAIFGGRVGDGCLADSTLFRIDRGKLTGSLIVFPFGNSARATLLPSWRLATQEEGPLIGELVGGTRGVQVTSAIGPLRVDIEGVAELFESSHTGAPASGSGSC